MLIFGCILPFFPPKVWNIQNGHNVHQLEVVDEAEVTGLVVLRSRTLLAVGWNRKIVLYHFWEPGVSVHRARVFARGGIKEVASDSS